MVTPFSLTPAWVGGALRGAPDLRHVGKEAARCDIATGRLTVPVVGGAAVLKCRDANPLLSEHGKWRREHLGAWNAAYGRTPYFTHLMPQIEEVYADSEGITLDEFSRRLLGVALRWLDPEALTATGDTIEAVRREIRAKVDPRLSIFDAIFRLGRETVFAL